MPEYLNTGNKDILLHLYNDLIYRDIVVRNSLRNPKSVRELGAYLFFTISRFSYSLKQQARNPKKIYCIDTGLMTLLSMSFSKDHGRMLENMVFIHFRRMGKNVFYYRQKGKCDFIIATANKIEMAVQVCYHVNDDNLERELNGLLEALNELDLKEGYIFTFDQKDEMLRDGKRISLVPVWEWMVTK